MAVDRMKSTRLMVIIMLVAVCGFSWFMLLTSSGSTAREYAALIEQAESYRSSQLYELAIESYNQAVELKPDKETYQALIETCEEYYAETHTNAVRKLLIAACASATSEYPREPAYWERYAQLYLDEERYQQAADILSAANTAHASSEALDAQSRQALYAYKLLYGTYQAISLEDVNSSFVAQSDDGCLILSSDGSVLFGPGYRYIGPQGEDGMILCITDEGEVRLYDKNHVLRGRFYAPVEEAYGYGDGLVPVRLSGREDWCYLNSNGNEVLSGYWTAGMFQNGQAAVQNADGTWCLIDTGGTPVGEESWEEIRLNESGAYIQDGTSMMKSGDQWRLYRRSGSEREGFSCDEIDICRNEPIAFQRDGLWGFVQENGDVVIEPAYENARSFSGGVAAVFQNGLWGFIDVEGVMVVEPSFVSVGFFTQDGSCAVQVAEDADWQLLSWRVAR